MTGSPIDLTTLGASAGVGGAITLVLTQVVKQLSGWNDRKALATAMVIALAIALAGWAALHSATVNEGFQVVVAWLGNASAAIGGYHLLGSNSGGTSSTPVTPDSPDAAQALTANAPPSNADPTPIDTTPIPETPADPAEAAKQSPSSPPEGD